MENWQERQIMLIGEDKCEKLRKSSVMVFGAGGVGGYTIEALARAGVGKITVVDSDVLSDTNRNRQILALTDTVGKYKTETAESRIGKINPECAVRAVTVFAGTDNTAQLIEEAAPDFVADAIDNVTAKLCIAEYCVKNGIPLISCMGTGNKLDMTRLHISDISKTTVCPLAKAVRLGLRSRGINHLPVVFSDENPVVTGSRTPSSISFVPAAAGLMLAQYIITTIIGR